LRGVHVTCTHYAEFFTKIPHILPASGAAIKAMTVTTKEKLKEKQELLQASARACVVSTN
jgi:hypothetical protein